MMTTTKTARMQVLDDNETAYLQNQLEHVSRRVYEKKTPEYKCREHIPVSFEAGAAAETVAIDIYEEIGMAKEISSYGDDWPRVDIIAERLRSEVVPLGNKYGYNFQEIRTSIATMRNLPERKAYAAKRFIMKQENTLAYLGNSKTNQLGLLTYPTTPRIVSDIRITDDTISNELKLKRLNEWANVPFYLGEHEVTAVLMSKADYKFLTTTSRSTQSDTFLMDLFRKGNPNINYVDWCAQCEGAGVNGTDVMIFYVRDPDHVVLNIPQDFEQLPPDDRGKEVIIHCHERFAGVQMIKPLSAVIVENVG